MTVFSALGFDPAPGEAATIRGFATQLVTARDSADDALALMRGDRSASWQGEAADAFRRSLNADFQPHLDDIRGAFESSRVALTTWADALDGFQVRAAQLETRAQAAQRTLDHHHSDLQTAAITYRANPTSTAGADDFTRAQQLVVAAQGEIDAIRAEARGLQADADTCASACATSLRTGTSLIASHGGSAWDRFTSWVGDIGDAIADGYDWFMDNVMPILEDIVDTLGPIMAVVALFTSFIPGVGQITGGIALGLAVAGVAIDGLQALHGEEGAAQDFFMGLAGLAVGGALGRLGTALGDGTREVLVPVVQQGSRALAGGGAMAGSLTMALRYSPQALQANTMWMATKLTQAQQDGQGLATALAQPAVNLVQRVHNLATGNGPRTDAERERSNDDAGH